MRLHDSCAPIKLRYASRNAVVVVAVRDNYYFRACTIFHAATIRDMIISCTHCSARIRIPGGRGGEKRTEKNV